MKTSIANAVISGSTTPKYKHSQPVNQYRHTDAQSLEAVVGDVYSSRSTNNQEHASNRIILSLVVVVLSSPVAIINWLISRQIELSHYLSGVAAKADSINAACLQEAKRTFVLVPLCPMSWSLFGTIAVPLRLVLTIVRHVC